VAQGGLCENFQRRVIQNFSVGNNSAMTVRHVFAQAHVRDDEQRRQFFFQQPHCLLHDAVPGERAGRRRIFFFRNAEQQNRRHAERVRRRRLAHNFVRRQLEHAGHGGDGAAQFFAAAREQRQHELLDAQARFANEFPQRGRRPQPARAIIWKLSGVQIHELILVSNREEQKRKVNIAYALIFRFDLNVTGCRIFQDNQTVNITKRNDCLFWSDVPQMKGNC